MTAAILQRSATAERERDAVALVRDAHRQVADLVAELDLDDRAVWVTADRSVARVVAEAYGVVGALTGEQWSVAEPGVPPVVRIRELSVAQRRLDATLDKPANRVQAPEVLAALAGSATRVTEAARWLSIVTRAAE
ncbi:MAG TPA: hypothetical protein VFZ63_01800 [Jiangellaceae bacterium]